MKEGGYTFAGTQTVVCQYAHQLKKLLHAVKL